MKKNFFKGEIPVRAKQYLNELDDSLERLCKKGIFDFEHGYQLARMQGAREILVVFFDADFNKIFEYCEKFMIENKK